MSSLFLSSAFCILSCRSVFASGEADAFALPGVGARPAGMGGAFIGLGDGVESIYYNPAGLAQLKESHVTAMYQTPMLETSRGFLGYNKPWKHPAVPGSFALGWLRMQSSDIELTNEDERVVGSDSLSNDLVMLGAGVEILENVAIGLAAKYFRFDFNGFNESGFGIDLGAQARWKVLRFGLALTDLDGTTLKGDSIVPGAPEAEDEVPMRLRPGIAVVLNRPLGLPIDLNLLADEMIRLQGAQETRLSAGLEVWGFDKHAAVRGGYQEASGPSFGASARVGSFQIDYAYLFSLHLEDENRIGLTLRF